MDNEQRTLGYTDKEWQDFENAQPLTQEQTNQLGIAEPIGQTQDVKPQEANPNPRSVMPNVQPVQEQAGSKKPNMALDVVGSIGQGMVDGVQDSINGMDVFNKIPELNYTLYKPQTQVGDVTKTLTKYLTAGALFIAPTGRIGTALKGIKGLEMAGAALEGAELFKTAEGASKLAKAGAAIGNITIGNSAKNFIGMTAADYFAYTPEDGHLADTIQAYPQLQNPLTEFLSAKADDTIVEAKLKNVIEGLILSPVAGLVSHGLGKIAGATVEKLKGAKAVANAATEEEIKAGLQTSANADIVLDNFNKNTDILKTIEESADQADELGLDPHELLRDKLPTDQLEEADKLLTAHQNGDSFHVNDDGSLSIAVTKWEDAHKVSKEEYKTQIQEPIQEMDTAFKQTLVDRSVIGENEDVFAKQKSINKVVDHYKEKWDMPNKVNVEMVDGLKSKGEAIEGVTKFNTKSSNITIKIDQNSPNKYAVLRSELEHARDYAKGDYKNLPEGQHFSRYDGSNETEMASDYLHKKSTSKAVRDGVLAQPTEAPVLKDTPTEGVSTPTGEIKPLKEAPVEANPEQLQLNFTSTDELADAVVSGAVKPKTTQDIDKLLDATANITKSTEDVTQKGNRTFKGLANEGDQVAVALEKIKNVYGVDSPEFKQSLALNDAQLIEKVGTRQAARTEIIGSLTDKIKNISEITTDEEKAQTIDLLYNLTKTDKVVGSKMGMVLNERKLTNSALKSFVEDGLTSDMIQNGDVLAKHLTESFNKTLESFFTTGKNPSSKEMVQKMLLSMKEAKQIPDELLRDVKFMKKIESSIIDMNKVGRGSLSEAEFDAKLQSKFKSALYSDIYDDVAEALKLADPSADAQKETLKTFFNTKVRGYYINNLLSSPVTSMKNILSGFINMALNPMTKAVAGATSDQKQLVTEAADMMAGYLRGFNESFNLGVRAFKDGKGKMVSFGKDTLDMKEITDGMAKVSDTPNNIFNIIGNWTGKALEFPSKFLGATDEAMTQMNYRSLAYAKSMKAARQEFQNLGQAIDSDTLMNRAEQIFKNEMFDKDGIPMDTDLLYESKKGIYQNNLSGQITDRATGNDMQMEQAGLFMKFGKTLEGFGEGFRWFMPFIRTPMNIGQQTLDYSAFAFLDPATQYALKQGGEEAAMAKAKVMIGTGAVLSSVMLGTSGKITGSLPTDKQEAKALLASGWQPYSIVGKDAEGNTTYTSYQGLEPIATFLGIGADFASAAGNMAQGDFNKAANRALSSIVLNLTNKTYLSQVVGQLEILNVTSAEDMTGKIQKTLGRTAKGFLPLSGGLTWLENTGELKNTRNFLDVAKNNYPFLDAIGNPIEPKRNAFGEIEKAYLVKTGFRQLKQGHEPEDMELSRLAEQGYTPITQKVNLVDNINLTDYRDPQTKQSAQDKITESMGTVTIGGRTLREAIRDTVKTAYYQGLPDGVNEDEDQLKQSKRKELNSVFREYLEASRDDVVRSNNFIDKAGINLQQAKTEWDRSKYINYRQQGMSGTAEQLNSLF